MRILVIRYKKTRGVPEGGERASELNHTVLKQIAGDGNVDTYYIHDEAHRRTAWEYLQGIVYMPFGYYFGLTPQRVREIVKMAQAYEVVFVDRSVFGIVAKRLKEEGYCGRVVCFFHNVERVYFSAKYSRWWNPMRWLVVPCADRNDRWSCRYADKTIALSRRDDDELHRRYGRHADQLIPIAFVDRYQRDLYPAGFTDEKPLCMFLGAYFPANVEGIEWFVKNVLPRVNIRMQIVGKGMERLKEADWMREDIEVLSNVPDLEPLFEAADLMVLPIFKGSGMKVKTCESLMYGKNIIGTPEAWSGYELDYDRAGACCLTADEFAAAINDFCQHPSPRFNAYSREVFVNQYSAARMVDKFRAVVED
ncbi:MAG: glycosyltransferase [Bacteroidales bacterium]|nr:glycosyltransferase [Bacteroidales bacterium]